MTIDPKIEIRLATPADAPALAALANALDRDQGGNGHVHSAQTVLRDGFGANPVISFIMAAERARPVGYAMFSRFYNSDTAETGCFLNDLYVASDLQRSGVGRRLVAAVAVETAKRGGTFIWTGVYFANAPARTFYAALGARDEDARILEICGASFLVLAGRVGDGS